jgi:hypothetical protein
VYTEREMGWRRGFSLVMKAGFHPSDETLTMSRRIRG